jgi:hypothetical protein
MQVFRKSPQLQLTFLEVFWKSWISAYWVQVVSWPQCPAPVEEASEMPEGILVVNGCVPLGCGDVLMAHELGKNVYGQPCGQGRCGKQSSEIVRSESVSVTVFVFKAGSVDRVAYGPPDPAG